MDPTQPVAVSQNAPVTQSLPTPPRTCWKCGALVTDALAIYCPHCGADLFANQRGIPLGKQVYVYLISLFGPPFGLVWVFKYMKSDNEKTRIVGLVALGLTVISIVGTIWMSVSIGAQIQKAMSSLNGAQTGQGLGL